MPARPKKVRHQRHRRVDGVARDDDPGRRDHRCRMAKTQRRPAGAVGHAPSSRRRGPTGRVCRTGRRRAGLMLRSKSARNFVTKLCTGQRRRVAQRADGVAADAVGDAGQQLSMSPGSPSPVLDLASSARQPAACPRGRACTGRTTRRRRTCMMRAHSADHAGAVVHHDDAARAGHGLPAALSAVELRRPTSDARRRQQRPGHDEPPGMTAFTLRPPRACPPAVLGDR